MRFLCKFLFNKVLGWHAVGTNPTVKKYIVIIAPHTSNWDFILGKLFYCTEGIKPKFMIKEQWFKPPIGWLIRWLGGVPVNREKAYGSLLPLMKEIKKNDTFILNITPEGTRKKVKKWKRGFYKLAVETGLPIFMGKFDYKNRIIYIDGDLFYPTGDYEKDLKVFQNFYKENTIGKYPEKFDLNCIK